MGSLPIPVPSCTSLRASWRQGLRVAVVATEPPPHVCIGFHLNHNYHVEILFCASTIDPSTPRNSLSHPSVRRSTTHDRPCLHRLPPNTFTITRWRRWNRWLHPKTMVRPTSVVDVQTSDNYTRLVLRNPKDVPPRGGAFVYISAPPALGTDEAHAFTVALRGPPPGVVLDSDTSPSDVHTLYIKSCGVWTRALALTAKGAESSKVPESLLVDVDGFYDHVESFNSMMLEGSARIIVITGGSGMTCFMCMIQVACGNAHSRN